MRLIGIGLMAFLLAGIAILFSSYDIWERSKRSLLEIAQGPQLIFEPAPEVGPAPTGMTATILRAGAHHPLILSGLPAYQSAAFHLPVEARPTSGYLQINATFQVLDGVEGVLRISIDNTKRGEMLLRPGEAGRSLRIPLSPTDIARDQLVVSFSLQGEGIHSQCSRNEGLEAVVEIEATSALHLTLDRPLLSVGDRVNSWGQLVRIGWPNWLKEQEQTRRMIVASELLRVGGEAQFVAGPQGQMLNTAEAGQALSLFSASRDDRLTWPAVLAEKGANVGLRRFQRSTSWRHRYDLRDAEDGSMPGALALQLALGRAPLGGDWSVTVTLNNRLLGDMVVDADQRMVELDIALPEAMQEGVNLLEITATLIELMAEQCQDHPQLIAEMLPGTRLLPGKGRFSDGVTDLRQVLAGRDTVTFRQDSPLSAADAEATVRLLAGLVPEHVKLKPGMGGAQILAVAPGHVLEDGRGWLVFKDTQDGRLKVKPAVAMRLTQPALLVTGLGQDA